MDVLSVASEAFPLIKTGGLADVVGALPRALAAEDIHVRTLLPGYLKVLEALEGGGETLWSSEWLFGGPARVIAGHAGGLDLLVLDAPHLYVRPGNPYVGPDGKDWPDNPLRFAALSRVGADVARGVLDGWRPAAVHVHDWQTALVPAYLHYDGDAERPGTVLTVHNLAFQGQFDSALLPQLGLPPYSFAIDGVEYYGSVGYLKAGLRFADRITTVSPSYAAEIRTPQGGMGLDGLLRGRGALLSGILNGIDEDQWNPTSDPLLASRFDASHLAARAVNRAEIQFRFGLTPDTDRPLFAVVSRLTWQKGMDLLLGVLPTLLAEGAQLAVLGSGEGWLEAALRAAAAAHPGQIGCILGYDEPLAHLIQGGADALLIPSRFEPCGLTQLCALRYGTVPVVAHVGGLSDTIIDASPMALAAGVATGVQFSPVSAEMLETAIRRAAELYRQPEAWRRMQRNGMATDVSWRDPARRYAALLREVAR
jgi:starch synthase